MKNQSEKIEFSRSVQASVEIKDLENLGWDFDMPTQSGSENIEMDDTIYYVDITVDDEGHTTWCLTNTEKSNHGIWEGSDSERTGDDEKTIKDLEKLHSEGKLFNIKTEYYGA